MYRKSSTLLGLALPVLLLGTAVAAEPLPAASRWIPQDAIVALEISRPKALLDLVFDEDTIRAVNALPVYQQLASGPEFKQFQQVVTFLETVFDTDWKTGLGRAIGGGVTFAAGADESIYVVVEAEDQRMLERLHEILLGFARDGATKEGQPGRVASAEYGGVTGWTFGGDEAHVIVGSRLLLSNKPESLKRMIDLRADPEGASLAASPVYLAAQRAAGPDPVATAFVNLQVLKAHPPVAEALEASDNPLTALLFAGVMQSLRAANWVGMGLDIDGDALKLQIATDDRATDTPDMAAFAKPSRPGQGALPGLKVPRQIAGLSLYRDLHAFYGAKDDLFADRTSGLIFFENMMGIFFTGRDLTEEVLGQLEPEIRVVVAEQDYDPAIGTPALQIPSFAAIFRMKDPERFSVIMEEAWQKGLGLINFTRGQQAEPGLILDKPIHSGTKFTMSYFSTVEESGTTDLDARFNYRPSLATLGDYLVLSSTEDLTRDLIDALKAEMAGPAEVLAQTHSLLEIDAVQLASILDANRPNLVRQNMIDDGNTRDEAEAQIGLILTIVEYLGQASLTLGAREGLSAASLELNLNLPVGQGSP